MSNKKCDAYNECNYAGKAYPRHNEQFYCPDNVNAKCEIVAKKPKYKRVKAFCYKSTVSKGYIAWEKPTASPAIERGWLPCTILIEAKWLKDQK